MMLAGNRRMEHNLVHSLAPFQGTQYQMFTFGLTSEGRALDGGASTAVHFIILFSLTLFTRIPFNAQLLFDHDSVQFALALDNYDVYLHQPHPPGYFLYVMLGRLVNALLQNPNASFIWISQISSALLVLAVFQLGSEIFSRQVGYWAALLAITSPLLWFHSVLALSYSPGAFLACCVGLLCWRSRKDHRAPYLSAIVLGITAGFRQDLFTFLFPLWLYSIAVSDWRKAWAPVLLLSLTVTLWFVPMLLSAGGPQRYFAATGELWRYHNSTFAIWNAGLSSRVDVLLTFIGFLSYGIGVGTTFLLTALYLLLRTRSKERIDKDKVVFFGLWIAPAFLFYFFVFIHPYKFAYGMPFLPVFFILACPAIDVCLTKVKESVWFADLHIQTTRSIILAGIIISNAMSFCIVSTSFSAAHIRRHDQVLSMILQGIRNHFPSQSTVILGQQLSTFSGYRHVQYYLPQYKVYLAEIRKNPEGEQWHVFSAWQRKTILSSSLQVPKGTRYLVYVADPYNESSEQESQPENSNRLMLDDGYKLYYQEITEQNPTGLRFDSNSPSLLPTARK
jgi:hypothetical protein